MTLAVERHPQSMARHTVRRAATTVLAISLFCRESPGQVTDVSASMLDRSERVPTPDPWRDRASPGQRQFVLQMSGAVPIRGDVPIRINR